MVKPGAISEREIEWQLIVDGEDVRETRRILSAKLVLGLQTGGGQAREGGGGGYKIANFIVHMWIKFPPLKTLQNAHVPITPRWYRRELWGHVFGCSCACVCSGLPDCLRAAFVPALIRCQ